MRKKLVTLFLAMMLLVSMIPTSVFAEESQAGGMDFYSITLHFDGPTVVSYKKVSAKDKLITYINSRGQVKYKAGYIFAEPQEEYVVRAGDTRSSAYLQYKDNPTSILSNWYIGHALDGSIAKSDLVSYANFPYDLAYITGIQDGTVLQTKKMINLRGVMDISDDKGDPNPNIVFSDGYALDVEKDANGEYYLIDLNGYRVTKDGIWYDVKGRRVELFETDEKTQDPTEWIPLKDSRRVKEDGTIKKIEATDTPTTYTIKEVWDMNGDGKVDDADKAIYNDPNTTFTVDDIVVDKDSGVMLRGTPVSGLPQMKTKLTGISIKIDALGTELYEDLTADPQQQNSIVLTIGDYYKNIVAAQEYFDEKLGGKVPTHYTGRTLATLKSVTTRTSVDFSDANKSDDGMSTKTAKTLYFDINEETLASLTKEEFIYLNFNIATQQGAAAYDQAQLAEDELMDIKLKPFDSTKYPAPVVAANNNTMIIIIAAAAVAVIAIVIIVIVVVSKSKKKKAAAPAAEVADDAETKE